MRDQNQTEFGCMFYLIKQILYVVLIVETIGVIELGTYFLFYFPTAKEAYLEGFFVTISAISNAGFGLSNDSLAAVSSDYFVQSIVIFLISCRSICCPVVIQIKRYLFKNKNQKKKFRFTLVT